MACVTTLWAGGDLCNDIHNSQCTLVEGAWQTQTNAMAMCQVDCETSSVARVTTSIRGCVTQYHRY